MTDQIEPPKRHGRIWHFFWDKPPGWDEPANKWGRRLSAIGLGLSLIAIRALNGH